MRTVYPLLILFLFAWAVRALPLEQSHYWDDSVYLQHGKIISEGRENFSELHYRPPLLSVFLAAGFWLFNHQFMATIVTGLLGALGVLFLYGFTRELFGEAAAWWSSILYAVSPALIYYSHRILTGIPALTFLFGSLWCYHRGLRQGWRWHFSAGILFALAILTRFTSLYLGLYFVLHWWFTRHDAKDLLVLGGGALAGLTPYLTWNQLTYGHPLSTFITAFAVIQSAPTSPWLYIQQWFSLYHPIVTAGFATGAYHLILEKRQDRYGLLLWGILFFLYMHTIIHQEIRYLLPLSLVLYSIGGYGLWRMVRGVKHEYVVLALLAFALFAPHLQTTHALVDNGVSDDMRAAAYLNEHAENDTIIYAMTRYPILAYYSGVDTTSLYPPDPGFKARYPLLMSAPGYFIDYPEDPLKETFFTREHFREEARFGDATIYAYHPQGFVKEAFSIEERTDAFLVGIRVDSAGDVYREDGEGNIWQEDAFRDTLDTLRKHNASATLGVIPRSFEDLNAPSKQLLLDAISDDLFTLAQTGYTYKDNEGRSEFSGLPLPVQQRRIQAGKELLEEFSEAPRIFIPPYNLGDNNTMRAAEEIGFSVYSSMAERDFSQGMARLDAHFTLHDRTMRARDYEELISLYERYRTHHPYVVIALHHFAVDIDVLDRFLERIQKDAKIIPLAELAEWKTFVEESNVTEVNNTLVLDGSPPRSVTIQVQGNFSSISGSMLERMTRLRFHNIDNQRHTICVHVCHTLEANESLTVEL